MCLEDKEGRREQVEEAAAAGGQVEAPPAAATEASQEARGEAATAPEAPPAEVGEPASAPEAPGEEVGEPSEAPAEQNNYQERIRALEQEVEAKTREVQEYIQHLQRLQADFANFRKRVRREQEELREKVAEELLRHLLPVVDNLERAIVAAEQDGASVESLRTGVVMVHRQLSELLFKEGVSAMASVGQAFDPSLHHAVATVESEEYEENTVVDELQKGYLFRGRLLRPALVRVAKRPAKEKVIPLRPEEGENNG